jgi:4'-phosphopantetheinyl transferase
MTRAAPVHEDEPRELAHIADAVSLWWCDLDVAADALPRLAATLAPAEHARAARFGRDSLRARWVAGRASLRLVLGHALRTAPADVPIVRGDRGRPQLGGIDAKIDFNVSHTAGVALIGIVRNQGTDIRIGVDVERGEREVAADHLARRVLTPGERAALAEHAPDERRRRFLRYWTCKEAMSKATGDGIAAAFRRIDVTLAPALRVNDGPAPYRPPAWTLVAAPVPDGYIATVALWDRAAAGAGPVLPM